MSPEYPLGESRLRFSVLARVSATRFSAPVASGTADQNHRCGWPEPHQFVDPFRPPARPRRSEEHTSELQSQSNLVCRLLLEKKKRNTQHTLQASEYSITPSIVRSNTCSS